jgi:hypothetical protein
MFNVGSGARCAVGREVSWGTPVADTMLMNFNSESISLKPKKQQEESLLASKATAALDLVGMTVAGDLSFILKPENAGYIMKAILGGTDVVTVVSATQKHSIVAAAAGAAFPSLTIYVDRKAAIKRYSGMKVASAKITAKAGDYVRVSLTLKGKDESTGTIVSTTLPTLKSYKFVNGTLSMGGTAIEFTDFELSIDNAMDDGIQTSASGLYNTEPLHGTRKIEFTVGTPYEANAESIREANFKTEALLNTVLLHLESPSIIASTNKYRMDVTLNNVAITDEPVNVSGAGILTTKIKGEATAVGSTEPIVAEIYDAQATAY